MRSTIVGFCLFLISLSAVLIPVTLWHEQAKHKPIYEKIDLAQGDVAHTSHVYISAIARHDLKITVIPFGKNPHDEYFIPLVPPNWNRHDAISYFWKTDQFDTNNQRMPEHINRSGLLENLPGSMKFRFKRKGFIISDRSLMLNDKWFAGYESYIWIQTLGLIFALLTGPFTVISFLGRRRGATVSH